MLGKLELPNSLQQDSYSRDNLYGCLWPAPFNEDTWESAYAFCLELRTWNDADSAVQPMPDKPYLLFLAKQWHLAKSTGSPLAIEKCRRMVVSWLARGLELHWMGLRKGNCLLGGNDFEAAGKHVWRLSFLYEELRRSHPHWNLQGFSSHKGNIANTLKDFGLVNGSTCIHCNAEDSSVRGDGVGLITFEEFTKYPRPAEMLGQARIITQGTAFSTGGFTCCIGNADSNPDWQLIKRGGLGPDEDLVLEETECEGIERKVLPDGTIYLKLHYFADPDKDSVWLEKTRAEMASQPVVFEREILMNEDIQDGMPVFPTFSPSRHLDLGLRYVPGAILLGGIDAGQSRSPALILAQVVQSSTRFECLKEVYSDASMSMQEFAPLALEELRRFFKKELNGGDSEVWKMIRFYGDETIINKAGSDGTTAIGVAAKFGLNITPVSNEWIPRMSSVEFLLARELNGSEAGFVVNPKGCPVLCRGFNGAYKWRASRTGGSTGPSQVDLKPVKDGHSHVQDALQTIAIQARMLLEGTGQQAPKVQHVQLATPQYGMDSPVASATGAPYCPVGMRIDDLPQQYRPLGFNG